MNSYRPRPRHDGRQLRGPSTHELSPQQPGSATAVAAVIPPVTSVLAPVLAPVTAIIAPVTTPLATSEHAGPIASLSLSLSLSEQSRSATQGLQIGARHD
jgi:hypothetical protein